MAAFNIDDINLNPFTLKVLYGTAKAKPCVYGNHTVDPAKVDESWFPVGLLHNMMKAWKTGF